MTAQGFELVQGVTTVVFGPNGSGKTTLLRRLFRDGVDGVAYLPQDPYLFRGQVGANLGLGLTPEQAGLAGQYARRFGLRELLAESSGVASGGERARVALARTLARPDELVLLDEPLAAVDMAERPMMASAIREALHGRTGVVVTHELDQVVSLGDRMAVMIDGDIAQQGPVAEVMAQPQSEIIAKTVGISNVYDGTVVSRDGPIGVIDIDGTQIVGTVEAATAVQVRVLVPAEAVTLISIDGSRGQDSARNRWTGTVTEMVDMARVVEVVVDVGVPLRVLVTRGSVEHMGLASGKSVIASVKASAVRVVAR